MFTKSVFVFFVILAMATMACGVSVNLPVDEMSTGPSRTEQVMIPSLPVDTANLTLEFGAGELNLAPGAGVDLLAGTATYNVKDLAPNVVITGGNALVRTGDLEIHGIPSIRAKNLENVWDFQLGDQPMNLVINAGAYQGDMEFGGLALRSLEINDGAADVEVYFSKPNMIQMDEFSYMTGASDVELKDLANANFNSMLFRAGAGNYQLDFSGQLQHETNVTIETGVSQVKIVIPDGVSAQLTFSGGLSNIDLNGDWQKDGNDYIHAGNGPTIFFRVTMGAGNLELDTTN